MRNTGNTYLVVAGCCSLCIALLHVAVIVGGGDWYRLIDPGEKMAVMAEDGSWVPIMFTAAIILIFLIFGPLCFFRGRDYPPASIHDGCPGLDILCLFNKGGRQHSPDSFCRATLLI